MKIHESKKNGENVIDEKKSFTKLRAKSFVNTTDK